jgi:hypothetical protein
MKYQPKRSCFWLIERKRIKYIFSKIHSQGRKTMQKEKEKKQEKEKYTKPVLTNHGRLKDVTAALITAIIIDPNKFHS